MSNSRNKAIGLVLLLTSFPIAAWDGEPVDQPRVVAIGQFDDGNLAVCYGVECGQVVADLGHRFSHLLLEEGLDVESGMDRNAFCKALNAKRPSGCDADNPPSTPGLDPSWQPNGCGTGVVFSLLANIAIDRGFGDYYSGDLDRPYHVSFRSACDGHDTCWAVGGNRATCDDNFHYAMRSACGAFPDATNRSRCFGFAGAYYAGVSISDISNNNYQEAVEKRQCALWALDVKQNKCKA